MPPLVGSRHHDDTIQSAAGGLRSGKYIIPGRAEGLSRAGQDYIIVVIVLIVVVLLNGIVSGADEGFKAGGQWPGKNASDRLTASGTIDIVF